MDNLTKRERVWVEAWIATNTDLELLTIREEQANFAVAAFDRAFPPPAEPDAPDCDPPLTFAKATQQGIVPTCDACMFAKQPKTPGPLHGIADGCVDCMHAGGPADGMHHQQGCCSNWIQRLPSQPSPLDETEGGAA